MLRTRRAFLLPLLALALLPVPASATVKPHKLRCFGHVANVVGTSGDDVFGPTFPGDGPIVVVGLGGSDTLYAPDYGAGNGRDREVYFCGGSGSDGAHGTLYAMNGGGGKDWLGAQCLPRIRKSIERVWDEDC